MLILLLVALVEGVAEKCLQLPLCPITVRVNLDLHHTREILLYRFASAVAIS